MVVPESSAPAVERDDPHVVHVVVRVQPGAAGGRRALVLLRRLRWLVLPEEAGGRREGRWWWQRGRRGARLQGPGVVHCVRRGGCHCGRSATALPLRRLCLLLLLLWQLWLRLLWRGEQQARWCPATLSILLQLLLLI